MPIRYILDNDHAFVLCEISGIVKLCDIERMSHEIMGKVEKSLSYKEFYMFSENSAYWAASKEYYEQVKDEMVQRDKEFGYKREKIALVTFDEYGKMVVPMWKAVTNDDAEFLARTEVFQNVAEAVSWLDIRLDMVEAKLDQIHSVQAF